MYLNDRRGKRLLVWMALVVGALAGGTLYSAMSVARVTADTGRRAGVGNRCPWVTSTAAIPSRVAQLMRRMSLADEVALLHGIEGPYEGQVAGNEKLCIPELRLFDGPNGVRMSKTTQLPSGTALAATFDPALARSYGGVIGSEDKTKGVYVDLGPTINIIRDPRWGRAFESYSEDPYLTAQIATADVEGVQSEGTLAQVKHWAVYNQESHRNTSADDVVVSDRAMHEIYTRAYHDVIKNANPASVMCSYATVNGVDACQNRMLYQILRGEFGFKGFVTSDWGGTHSTVAAANAGLDMEMPGSKYFGDALVDAVRNGSVSHATVDEMVRRILTQYFRFGLFTNPRRAAPDAKASTPAHVRVALQVAEQGAVLLKNVDHVLPLTGARAGTIAVIGPAASVLPVYSGGGSAHVSGSAHVTPLQGIRSMAPPGVHVVYQQGLPAVSALPSIPSANLDPNYVPTAAGGEYEGTLTVPESGVYVLGVKNPCRNCYAPTYLYLDGKEVVANPGTPSSSRIYAEAVTLRADHHYRVKITGESGGLVWGTPTYLAPWIEKASSAAKSSRVAVVVVSDGTESEGADRPTLALPSAQNELISAVAAANPKTVIVVDAGAPITMPWLHRVAAVVDMWYPGEQFGNALASILYGKVNPSGKLPITFPVSLAEVPAHTPEEWGGIDGKVHYSEGLDVGYRWYDARHLTPLFPFGYGLSYTTFAFSDLHVSPGVLARGGSLRVSAEIRNTGERAGADVVQAYLSEPAAAGEPPKQLVAFQKVYLGPRESRVVHFVIPARRASRWDPRTHAWQLVPGQFFIRVGDSSRALPLKASFQVK